MYDIRDPLKIYRWKLLKKAGFYDTPGAEAKQCVVGLLYALSANITDPEGLFKAIKWDSDAPFITLDKKHVPKELDHCWDAFLKYIMKMMECLEKLPALAESIASTCEKASTVGDEAEGDLEALDMMAKIKAGKNLAVNIKNLSSLPALCKQTTEKLKLTLGDIQASIQVVKDKGADLDAIGADCKKNGKLTPKDCYIHKEAPIPYPEGEKLKRYEERIAAWKKHRATKGKH